MKFVTALNCMDGRTQLPVNDLLREKFSAEYVDTITEPGINKVVAEGSDDDAVVRGVFMKIDISVNAHGSSVIAVVGHHDCAGNPSSYETQLAQIRTSVAHLKEKYPAVHVLGIWVDDAFSVHIVEEAP